jgi:hypothetical protein
MNLQEKRYCMYTKDKGDKQTKIIHAIGFEARMK